jgi:hypothetical protein
MNIKKFSVMLNFFHSNAFSSKVQKYVQAYQLDLWLNRQINYIPLGETKVRSSLLNDISIFGMFKEIWNDFNYFTRKNSI